MSVIPFSGGYGTRPPLITSPGSGRIDVAVPQGLAETASWYKAMQPKWEIINALLDGTESMRVGKMRATFLPQYEGETDSEYANRVSRSWAIDIFRDAVEKGVGGPFSKPVSLVGVPSDRTNFFLNVDRQGNSLSRFARDLFYQSLAKGYSHIWIDFSEKTGPYWVHLPPEQLLAAYCEIVNGKEVLTHIRIRECFIRLEGYEERTVEQIKVIDADPLGREPARFSVFENSGTSWNVSVDLDGVPQRNIEMGLSYIPLITNYTQRKSFLLSDPPLYPVAEKNIEHFQSASEQKEALTCGRFQMLILTGVEKDTWQKMKFGPRVVIGTDKENAKAYWIEPTGAALEAGRKDMEAIIEDANRSQNSLYQSKTITEVATPAALEEGRRTSWLQDMALGLQESLNKAMQTTADYEGISTLGSAQVNLDFTPMISAPWKVDALHKAHAEGLANEVYLRRLKDFGVLAETDDPAALAIEMEKKQLETQMGADNAARGGMSGDTLAASRKVFETALVEVFNSALSSDSTPKKDPGKDQGGKSKTAGPK